MPQKFAFNHKLRRYTQAADNAAKLAARVAFLRKVEMAEEDWQGLRLVNFQLSAQPEPFLTQNTP